MEAARKEVERLTNGCNLNGVKIIGMIYTLSAVNDKYEPISEKTVFFDNKKDLAKFYIARDKDGKLFKYPYSHTLLMVISTCKEGTTSQRKAKK